MSRRWSILLVCLCVAAPLSSRDKFQSAPLLSDEDAIWLGGSAITLVRHPTPKPRVMTMRGAIFQNATGWNAIADASRMTSGSEPADVLEREFSALLSRQYGAKIKAEPVFVEGAEWTDVAAAPTDTPYLLDLRTTRLALGFRKMQPDYWVGFGVRVALIERASARPMFVSTCYTDTVDHPDSPPLKDLEANDSRLLRDVMASLAWKCFGRIAADLVPNPDAIPLPPRNLLDPLADYAWKHPRE
jgi:hypothetical protein